MAVPKLLKKIPRPSEAGVKAKYSPPQIEAWLKWKRDMDDLPPGILDAEGKRRMPGHVRRAEREP